MPVNIPVSIPSHGLLSDLTGFATVARIWRRWRLQPWKAESFKSARTPELGAKTLGVVGFYLNPHEKAVVVVAALSRSTRVPSTSNSTSRTGLQVDVARWAEQPTVVGRRNGNRRSETSPRRPSPMSSKAESPGESKVCGLEVEPAGACSPYASPHCSPVRGRRSTKRRLRPLDRYLPS
jgi:hypothetical protein